MGAPSLERSRAGSSVRLIPPAMSLRCLRAQVPARLRLAVVLLGSLFCGFVAAQSVGISASDNAGNGYGSGSFNGTNNGFGFGSWTTAGGTNAGAFTSNPANNAGGAANNGGGIGNPAFGLFANSGQTASAVRDITGGLALGQTIRLDLDNGFINTGGTVGFGLRNSGGQNLFEFFFAGGNSSYSVLGSALQTFGAFTGGGLTSYFTMTSTTAFVFQVSSNGGTSFSTFTGSISNAGTVANFRLFNANAGAGGNNDAFYNNFQVRTPTWNGNASANFSAISWAGGAAGNLPVNGGLLAFNGGTGSITATNDATAGISSTYGISFNATSGVNTNATTYTITGNALTVNAGGITNDSTNLQTFNNNLTLGAAQTWNTGSGGLTVAGTVGGAGALTKTGSGTLELGGSNTFSGALAVQAGTVRVATVNDASSNGPLGNSANAVVLGNTGGSTGTLQYTGATASSNKTFTMAAGGTGAFQIDNAGATLTLSGAIGGSGGLTKTGAGTLRLTTGNTYTGTTTISGGTLVADANGANRALGGTTNIVVNAGGTLAFAQSNQVNAGTPPTMTLAGGRVNANSNTVANNTTTLGALTLTASSIIDLATGTGATGDTSLLFAASNAIGWTGGATLSIYNWGGTAANGAVLGSGTDVLRFGNSATGLNSGQLAQIVFYSDSGVTSLGQATILSDGTVVPVPEPATVAAAALALLLVARRMRRNVKA